MNNDEGLKIDSFFQKKLLLGGWIVLSILLLLYSFTQIDLNLTFSQLSIWQVLQKTFQNIGYFQRTLSTGIYMFLLLFSFVLYLLTFLAIKQKRILRADLRKIILIVSGILLFSYNAFSYDLFNYIFDARIVTHYGENPYLHKPQDFIGDPMLNFMRGVHRPYPYGPVWLAFTTPLSFFGTEFFLVTFYLFKLLIVGSFLGTCFFIEKILGVIKPKMSLLGLMFFALNPLVIIEGIVSGPNDVVMTFLAVSSLYFLIKNNYFLAALLFILSVGIKFVSIILLPFFAYIVTQQLQKKPIPMEKVFLGVAAASFIGVLITSFAAGINKNSELQPWYMLNLIPFAALVSKKKLVFILVYIVSIGLLVSYIPYILFGEWPKNIVELKNTIFILSVCVSGLLYFVLHNYTRVIAKKSD